MWLHIRQRALAGLAVVMLGAGPAAHAQTGPRYVRYSMDHGLSNNSVYCLHQDRTGFLWFGTFAGLNRYDGTGFRVYKPGRSASGANLPGSLQGSVIFALEEDIQGRLWVGTDGGGLSVYQPATDSFETWRNQPGTEGLPADRIFSLASDARGGLWIGTGGGGLAFREPTSGKITRIRPPGPLAFTSVRCIDIRPDGSLLLGTEDAGLLRYQPEGVAFTKIRLAGETSGLATVRALVAGPDHRVWVGMANGAVEVLRPGASATEGVLPPGTSAVRALSFDAVGRLWVGYESDGVAVLDVSRNQSRILLRDPGAGNVRAIGTDRHGLVWITAKDGGVMSHDPRSERFTALPMRSVRGMSETRGGEVLVGTDGAGLFRIQGSSMMPVRLPDGFGRVYSVLEDRLGGWWIGTDGAGLLLRDAQGRDRIFRRNPRDARSISSDVVWALLEDRAGTIWIGTEGGGLNRWDPVSGTFARFQRQEDDPTSLLGSSVRAIRQARDGRLWIGTWDGGLSRLDPATGRFERFPRLADTTVHAVLEDSKGRVWIGTGAAGLAQLHADGTFTYVSKKDGLAGDTVTGIMEDDSGALWIATAERLSRYEPSTGSIFNFGEEDGLADSECAQNAYLQSRDGTLWVGGPEGATRFRPEAVLPDIRPPDVVLTRLEAYGEAGPYEVPLTGAPVQVELDWRNTGLRFEAAVLDYGAPRQNRYAMKIEGLSQEWISLGEQHGAVIPPLPPGTFTVRVRGSDGNGVRNAQDAAFTILVKPPLWRRPLAMAAAGLGLVGVVGGAMLLRMRAMSRRNEILRSYSRHIQEAREEERIAAAREVHDEIGQHLAALNLQAYWINTHPDAPPQQREERLSEMLGSIAEAMNAVKTVATNLRPVALDALTFAEAVAWYAKVFNHRSNIPVALAIDEGFPAIRGPLATALFRVLQEALTNVSRHAHASNVSIHLSHGNGLIQIDARDDGVGIAPGKAEADDSFGIIGMRERCAAFGGHLQILGGPGEGTTLTVSIPFTGEVTDMENG